MNISSMCPEISTNLWTCKHKQTSGKCEGNVPQPPWRLLVLGVVCPCLDTSADVFWHGQDCSCTFTYAMT